VLCSADRLDTDEVVKWCGVLCCSHSVEKQIRVRNSALAGLAGRKSFVTVEEKGFVDFKCNRHIIDIPHDSSGLWTAKN
jgi:hypothetical protein